MKEQNLYIVEVLQGERGRRKLTVKPILVRYCFSSETTYFVQNIS